jgi:endoglycosylceramidase
MRIWLLLSSIVLAASGSNAAEGFVRAEGRWLVDASGRVLILHGVNVANSSKRRPYLPWQSRTDFEQIARWGFNSVRLLTVWAAIEPRPGQSDNAYIERLAERVRWCRELGLWVILDMHQDLYSEKYGADGAPAWACLDDGLAAGPRHKTWFLNYLQPPVIRAFDNFWANKPGPGRRRAIAALATARGVGIQERFAAAWQHLARRFRDEKAIVGYDILNEPFLGSAVQAAILSYANAAAKLTTPETKVKLLAALASPNPAEHYAEFAAAFRDPGVALQFVGLGGEPVVRFEREKLLPFYRRVASAIRKVDPHHVIFIEPTALGGAVRTGLARPTVAHRLEACATMWGQASSLPGRPHANIAFAPHYYEVATELGQPYEKARPRLHALLRRIARTADELGMPVWFGEWGNVGPKLPNGRQCIQDHLDGFNQTLASWCYWEYGRRFARLPFLDLLTLPYPMAALASWCYWEYGRRFARLPFLDLLTLPYPMAWVTGWKPVPQCGGRLPACHPRAKPTVEIRVRGAAKATWSRRKNGALGILCPESARGYTVIVRY